VAAGGGSILHFDGSRYRVGPDSAGANPGPASYRRGGPLTVTDCNVMLGKIQPAHFPRLFGPGGGQPLDVDAVRAGFAALAGEIGAASGRGAGQAPAPEAVAEGYIQIAVGNMANAIKQISVQRGHDVTGYTLTSFGGAGGQHACLVADAGAMRERAVERRLGDMREEELAAELDELAARAREDLLAQGVPAERIELLRRVHLRYEGTDSAIVVGLDGYAAMQLAFEDAYRRRFSFLMPGKALMVEAVSVEALGRSDAPPEQPRAASPSQGAAAAH
jgi:5-oxoprolinase (ATP-hydrolysing)